MESQRCDGSNHAARVYGHDGDGAAWRIVSVCPGCARRDEALLCAGRVRWVQEAQSRMTCPTCGRSATWGAFWRSIDRLEPSRTTPIAGATLIAAFRDYLESRGRASSTVALRVRHVERFAAEIDPTTATPEQIDTWARSIQAGRRPATVNSLIKSVRAFYAWADRFGIVRPNPCTLLDLVPNPQREARVIDDATYREAVQAADPHLRAMLMLGRLAGLRLAEIVALRAADDLGAWLVVIGKGNKQRRVPVVTPLRAALDAIAPAGGGFFFPAEPGRSAWGSVERIGTRWRAFYRAGGVRVAAPSMFDSPAEAEAWLLGERSESEPTHIHSTTAYKRIRAATGFNPHALRHAAGTAVYGATRDLRTTQAFLGHSQPTTTAIYVHVESDDLVAAVRAGAGGVLA